ncbi:TetR family transcriptional regulator [Pandoraea aquatica]|uniref:TetR family transcriptional regulator n=1 Tax=Pandoraea aquatica TaxID=2508290 RepID=A0A5E4U1H3_9BURK|nr:TetR/AcrR family transcriptional regulator [Pandoraea aquatica]VVD94026.1 TetR family transcriptional regulator [Pandoraea aquatica]
MAGTRQFDESALLEKVLTTFWQQGYSKTSMQELAAATGVQRGSLYNAYGDKEELFLLAFDLYRDRYVSEMKASLDHDDPRTALQAFFNFAITSMTTGTPSRGCLSTKTVIGTEGLEEPIHSAIQSLVDDIEEALFVRLSQPDATSRLNLPAREAARMAVTLTRGLVAIERIYRDKKRMKATAESFVKVLLKGE